MKIVAEIGFFFVVDVFGDGLAAFFGGVGVIEAAAPAAVAGGKALLAAVGAVDRGVTLCGVSAGPAGVDEGHWQPGGESGVRRRTGRFYHGPGAVWSDFISRYAWKGVKKTGLARLKMIVRHGF